MKRAAVREIKGSFGRYFAILAIIALGVGFFSGVRITTPAMVRTVDTFLNDKNFYDYQLISTTGWDEEDAEFFRNQPDVRYAEGSRSLDVIYTYSGGKEGVLKTHSLSENINGIKLAEGRMPQSPDECIIDADMSYRPFLGRKIYVSKENTDNTSESLLYDEFTIVGSAYSSQYIHFERGTTSIGNGSVSGFVYLMPEAFETEYYSELLVRFEHDYEIYSDEYVEYMRERSDKWETLVQERADVRFEEVLSSAEEELATGRSELEKSRIDGQTELDNAKQQLDSALQQLSEQKSQLEQIKAVMPQEYEAGMAQYEAAYKDYEKGLADYEVSLGEFNSKLAEAEKELSDAEKQLKKLNQPNTYVLDRNTNIGYACFENDSEIVGQVAKVFPIFFILVAALVCMTTMSRMVEEQRTQIGVFKALGYSEGPIMGRFMFYSGSASLLGCVMGYAIGTFVFPKVIWMTYKLMYIPLEMEYMFDYKLAVLVTAASLLCSFGTTWISCRYELSETAAGLMRPKAPKAGKRVLLERIPFIWNRLKFLHKVSIRNIFRYKKRLFMMILGISGCTALLLTGFGLKDSIAGFAELQYGEIITADATMVFRSSEDGKMPESLKTKLDECTQEYILLHENSWDLLYGERVKSINLEAPENFENMQSFMSFHDENGSAVDAPALNEAIISNSIRERYDVEMGDEITLRDENMRQLHLKVTGVFENHVNNLVYIIPETLEQQLSETVAFNGAFINFADDADGKLMSAQISKDRNVMSLMLVNDIKERMSSMMSSLNYIVILIIVCAAGLAFIVIYNLTNINITERIREIATIKVLGFSRREASAYVLRENLALTAIGALVGLGLGVLLHSFVMSQIVIDLVSFRVRILPLSFMYSIALTFMFNLLVNIFMELKLERINMAESLKSVD